MRLRVRVRGGEAKRVPASGKRCENVCRTQISRCTINFKSFRALPSGACALRSAMADAADREDTMDILVEMSAILNTGLDKESLRLLMRLCETGANPETLALIVQELRR